MGEVVWAKLTGFPWWPGYVTEAKKNGKFEVFYLSDFSKSYLPKSSIKKWEKKTAKIQGYKDLAQAHDNAQKLLSGKCSFN